MKNMQKGIIVLVIFICLGIASSLGFFFFNRSYTSKKVSFYPSNIDDWTIIDESYLLNGKIFYPKEFIESNSYPALILFHGLYRSLGDLEDICKELASKGVICLAIDFHGHGKSGGEFPFDTPEFYNATFPDAKGAYRFLQNKSFIDKNKIAVFGESLGGGAALYMALEGLTPEFVAWYPGSAYIYGDTPLYQCTSNSDNFSGLIIHGTKDECIRCKPDFTQNFVDINAPNVELKWIEGGTHGSGSDHSTYLKSTLEWYYNLWNII